MVLGSVLLPECCDAHGNGVVCEYLAEMAGWVDYRISARGMRVSQTPSALTPGFEPRTRRLAGRLARFHRLLGDRHHAWARDSLRIPEDVAFATHVPVTRIGVSREGDAVTRRGPDRAVMQGRDVGWFGCDSEQERCGGHPPFPRRGTSRTRPTACSCWTSAATACPTSSASGATASRGSGPMEGRVGTADIPSLAAWPGRARPRIGPFAGIWLMGVWERNPASRLARHKVTIWTSGDPGVQARLALGRCHGPVIEASGRDTRNIRGEVDFSDAYTGGTFAFSTGLFLACKKRVAWRDSRMEVNRSLRVRAALRR